jgi:CTP:molybdopterin cytidylyltransferase MocA
LIGRQYFAELSALPHGSAPRYLLKRHTVHLVAVDTGSVLQDLDLPEDYDRYRPA